MPHRYQFVEISYPHCEEGIGEKRIASASVDPVSSIGTSLLSAPSRRSANWRFFSERSPTMIREGGDCRECPSLAQEFR